MAYLLDTEINGSLHVSGSIFVEGIGDIQEYVEEKYSKIDDLREKLDDFMFTPIAGTPNRNEAYTTADTYVGWTKLGKIVYVHGYFTTSTALAWSSYAPIFYNFPPAEPNTGSTQGAIIHCGGATADRYVMITSIGQMIPSYLNDIPAGRYGISGVYIAAS